MYTSTIQSILRVIPQIYQIILKVLNKINTSSLVNGHSIQYLPPTPSHLLRPFEFYSLRKVLLPTHIHTNTRQEDQSSDILPPSDFIKRSKAVTPMPPQKLHSQTLPSPLVVTRWGVVMLIIDGMVHCTAWSVWFWSHNIQSKTALKKL